MVHKTIVPDRDGWYWAAVAECDEWELVRLRHGRVSSVGSEVKDRPEDWRFYAGPIEPPKLA